MKMKKVGNAIKIILFLLLFALIFSRATYVFRNKDNAYAVAGFYTHKENSMDVLFMGTSRVLDSIYPLDLWHEYGMASYNLAQHAQTLSMTYYLMQDAIEKQHPKVIVLDTFFLISGQKISNLGYTHKTIDNMEWSVPKIEALADYTKSEGFDNVFEYMINLSIFHSRWKELTKEDFNPIEDDTMGCEVRFGHKRFDSHTVVKKEDTAEIPKESLEYLNKMIALCKKNHIQLVLLTTPSIPYDEYGVPGVTQLKIYNSCYQLAEENDITYINLMHHLDELDFDYKKDMFDEGHVNPHGAKKITDYIGNYLMTHYGIPDRRGEQNYAEWNQWYEKFKQYQLNFYVNQEYDLPDYLTYLTGNPNYTIYLSVQGSLGTKIAPDIAEKLKALGLQKDWNTFQQESYLAILDGNQPIVEQSGNGLLVYKEKVNGVSVQMTSDGTGVQNATIILYNTEYRSPYQGLGIVVYDKTYHRVVDKVIFDLEHGNISTKK